MKIIKLKVFPIISIVILLLLFYYSFLSRIWVAEDAYISFRHIQNFWEGYGLTFNINSKIEGFTHPLWIFFLILITFFGIPMHFGSLLLGVIFTSLGMFILFYKFVYKKEKLNFFNKILLIIPFYFIVHDGFRDFWTSGMEFSLTFLLLSILLANIANKEIKNPILLSTILSLLYLTRPELGIFYIYYGLILLFSGNSNNLKINFINFLLYIFPFIAIAGGYHLFRWFYYEDLFPTTFYAKSSKILWKEGIYYIWHTLIYSPFLLPTLFAFVVSLIFRKVQENYLIRDFIPVFVHILYLITIGGDFMAYRFLLPDLTIIYVYFHIYFAKIIKKEQIILIGNFILLLLSVYYLFGKKFHTPVEKNLIVHEYRAYNNKKQPWKEKWFFIQHKWFERGKVFKELEKCLEYEPFIITNSWLDAKCAPEDDYGLGYFGYASGPKVIIIDQLGITDKEVALTGKTIWNRVGHNKSISTENIIKRKILFCSLKHKEYDQIMNTNFFPVIHFNQEFLFRLGSSYPERIKKLKELYKKIQNSTKEEDKKLYKYLKLIEETYQIQILELPNTNPKEFHKYDSCWKLKYD